MQVARYAGASAWRVRAARLTPRPDQRDAGCNQVAERGGDQDENDAALVGDQQGRGAADVDDTGRDRGSPTTPIARRPFGSATRTRLTAAVVATAAVAATAAGPTDASCCRPAATSDQPAGRWR